VLYVAVALLLRDVDRAAGLEPMEGARSDPGRSGKLTNAKAGQGAAGEALKPALVQGILATLGDSPVERRDAALVALRRRGAPLGTRWIGLCADG